MRGTSGLTRIPYVAVRSFPSRSQVVDRKFGLEQNLSELKEWKANEIPYWRGWLDQSLSDLPPGPNGRGVQVDYDVLSEGGESSGMCGFEFEAVLASTFGWAFAGPAEPNAAEVAAQ